MAKIYIQTGQSIRSDNNIYYKILEFLGKGANAFAYRCLCTSGQNRGIEFISNNNAVLGDFGLIKKIGTDSTDAVSDDIDLVNATVLSKLNGYVAMARYYRTPELVDYANRVAPLYLESDVFQLGLVLTELFTGKNPLLPDEDLHSPIELNNIDHINTPHHGKIIRNTLTQMLNVNREKRIFIDLAIDRFTGIYSM